MNIIIADDSVELLEMMKVLFRRTRFSAFLSPNLESLNNTLSKIVPDLIIIDAKFGDKDGREVIKGIKSKPTFKDIPIILMSGNPLLLQEYEDFQINDIIEKPFDVSILHSKINALVNSN